MTRRARSGRWLLRPGVRTGARSLAAVSAALLIVSALGMSAITAGIQISPTSIGRPEHAGNEAFGADRRAPIPRAAFEAVRAIPARGPIAVGGDRIYDIDVAGTSYRVHEFTTVGSAELIVSRPITIEYLIIGGGGGGGRDEFNSQRGAGGGGAGGQLTGQVALTPASYPVVVGAGGLGGRAGSPDGVNGEPTTAFDLTAIGGGGGGGHDTGTNRVGLAGGSGGGGSNEKSGGTAQSGQGFAGGQGAGNPFNGGGGGGAGAAGQNATTTQPGAGGAGRVSSLTGTAVTRGGGGGGRGGSGNAPGGAGGGGAAPGGAGQASTGSGGGANRGGDGGSGGSGIVILRYELPRAVWAPVSATGGTVHEYVADGTNGTAGIRYRVHTFTSNSTFQVTDPGTDGALDVLLVGGGGGGGTRHGGGGGGGGVALHEGVTVTTGSHAVTVGLGGAGMTATTDGANGGNSAFLGRTALGGGRGAGTRHVAGSGGSGGGGDITGALGAGQAGQGHAGAAGVTGLGGGNETGWAGGGGGGAGGPGGATSGGGGSAATAGNGGPGRQLSITGAPVHYGGGGGGSLSHLSTGLAGAGGIGGGGHGGQLGWEFFTHNANSHPTTKEGLDALFTNRTGSGVAGNFSPSTQGVTTGTAASISHGPVNILNWTSTGQLFGVIPNQNDRSDRFAFRVNGTFFPAESGWYRFTAASDDAVDVVVAGAIRASYYGGRGTGVLPDGLLITASGQLTVHSNSPVYLEAGTRYSFTARMHEIEGGEGLRVFWHRQAANTATAVSTWFQYAGELTASGRNGVNGLGGGGGAGGFSGATNVAGGRGGDGVVIVRYPIDREVGQLPGPIGTTRVAEAATYALLQWEAPAIATPAGDASGYRIERAAIGSGQWIVESPTIVAAGTLLTATVSGLPGDTRHRFRITPLGSADGRSTIVEPIAKGGDTVAFVGDEVVHRYTTAGTQPFLLGHQRALGVSILGAGGGGGSDSGSGGGGGALLEGRLEFTGSAGRFADVTVGSGGAGASWSTGTRSTAGGASSLTFTGPSGPDFTAVVAGGRGGSSNLASSTDDNSGQNNGAGGDLPNLPSVVGGTWNELQRRAGGAGGAARANGYTNVGPGNSAPPGGGLSALLAGVALGGGGGGGSANDVTQAPGTNGGGTGAGRDVRATAGVPNSGGGGGAGSASGDIGPRPNARDGESGGSGLVVLRYTAETSEAMVATGGDSAYYLDIAGVTYRVHEFRTVGSHTLVVPGDLTVEYLVVGGGGGGGAHVGGGGGGGGVRTGTTTVNANVSVVVGAGGAGASHPGSGRNDLAVRATSGGDSRLGDITALGGGSGGSWNYHAPRAGGSGGGAGAGAGGSGTTGQGFAGGAGRGEHLNGYPTGGGGGAGGVGEGWSTTKSGDGGPGAPSSITGTEIRYGGGGGGGVHDANTASWVPALPGSGRDGGGNGVRNTTTLSSTQHGVNGRGGGGGGGGRPNPDTSFGGNGGSGVVIVRYPMPWWFVPPAG